MRVIKGIIQRKFSCMVARCCTIRTPFLNITFLQPPECPQQSIRQCMHSTEHSAKTTTIFEKRGMKDVRREMRQDKKQCCERWCVWEGVDSAGKPSGKGELGGNAERTLERR